MRCRACAIFPYFRRHHGHDVQVHQGWAVVSAIPVFHVFDRRKTSMSETDSAKRVFARLPRQSCDTMITLDKIARRPLCSVSSGHGSAAIESRPDDLSDFGGFGGTTCLPSAVPELRASTLKQAVVIRACLRFQPLAFGKLFGFLPSFWERPRSRLALNPPLSPGTLNSLPAVGRRRWNTRERPLS